MQLQKVRMTLTGPMTGKTIRLNRRLFTNGVCELSLPHDQVGGLINYFQRSYQVNVTNVGEENAPEPVKDNKAIREDDKVINPNPNKTKKEPEDKVDDPNPRQAAIIAAVNGIEREEWIEQNTNPHPKVKDIATLMDDPTVTKVEICEVIEKWLS